MAEIDNTDAAEAAKLRHAELVDRLAAQQSGAPLPLAPSEPLLKAAEDLVHAFRQKYRKVTGAIRNDAPLRQEVTALNAALAATPQQATPTNAIDAAIRDALTGGVGMVRISPEEFLLDPIAQPKADATLEKACDLLSMTVGTLMSCRQKIGYVDNSPIAKLVLEVVEFLEPWPQKMPQVKEASALSDDDAWYLQDTRQTIGNDVLWWAEDGRGYTTDLSKAHVFGIEEARRQVAARGVDRAWPKAYIDRLTRPAVDFQYMDQRHSIWSGE